MSLRELFMRQKMLRDMRFNFGVLAYRTHSAPYITVDLRWRATEMHANQRYDVQRQLKSFWFMSGYRLILCKRAYFVIGHATLGSRAGCHRWIAWIPWTNIEGAQQRKSCPSNGNFRELKLHEKKCDIFNEGPNPIFCFLCTVVLFPPFIYQ